MIGLIMTINMEMILILITLIISMKNNRDMAVNDDK